MKNRTAELKPETVDLRLKLIAFEPRGRTTVRLESFSRLINSL